MPLTADLYSAHDLCQLKTFSNRKSGVCVFSVIITTENYSKKELIMKYLSQCMSLVVSSFP